VHFRVEEILQRFKIGEITLGEAKELLEKEAFAKMKLRLVEKLARLDVYREARTGIPEVILTEGKKVSWAISLLVEMARERGRAIASRINSSLVKELKNATPPGFTVEVHAEARIAVLKREGYRIEKGGKIGLIAAGTADLPVAEEARVFAQEMGCTVIHAYDVGIAGVHRVLDPLEEMLRAEVDVIIVVAGMDAVLPITVKGLVNLPVIGVPTSVGYGMGAKGLAPLLTMLQSCAPGLAVVNIDNGLGAAATAALIANRVASFRSPSHKGGAAVLAASRGQESPGAPFPPQSWRPG
jgi:hypothetical protein